MADPRALRNRLVQLQTEEDALDKEIAGLLDLELDEEPFPARVRMDPLRLSTEQRERTVAFKRRVVQRLKDSVALSPGDVEGPPTTLEEVDGVGPDLAEKLAHAGIYTVEDLRGAEEADLVAIDGIGRTTAKRLKEQVGGG